MSSNSQNTDATFKKPISTKDNVEKNTKQTINLSIWPILLWGTLFGALNLLLGFGTQKLLTSLSSHLSANQQHITLLLAVFSFSLLISLTPSFLAGYLSTTRINSLWQGGLAGAWCSVVASLLNVLLNTLRHQHLSMSHIVGLFIVQIAIGTVMGALGSRYSLWQRNWLEEQRLTSPELQNPNLPATSKPQQKADIDHPTPNLIIKNFKNWFARPDVRTALTLTLALRIFCSLIAAFAGSDTLRPFTLVGELPLHYLSTLVHMPPPFTIASWLSYFSSPWYKWDTGWYTSIASDGYNVYGMTAFLPLYPMLIRVTGVFLSGDLTAASLLVSTAFCFGALLYFYRLIERLSPVKGAAQWTVMIASILPVSFFFVAGYTESLFLWAMFGEILAVFDQKWGRVAFFGIAAALTKHQGPVLSLLVLPAIFTVLYSCSCERWSPATIRKAFKELCAPVLAAVAGPAVYLGWLYVVGWVLHQPLPWEPQYSVQGWHLHFTLPTTGIFTDLWSVAHPLIPSAMGLPADIIDVGAALFVALAVIFSIRRIPPALIIVSIVFWCVALIKVEPDGETMSAARYMLPMLPLAVLAGERLARCRPMVQLAWASLGSLSVLFFTWYFVLGMWVN